MSGKDKVLDRVPERFHNKLTVLDSKDLGQSVLYHISDDPRIRKFTPSVSNRMLSTEDRHIPRISCSSDLSGAIAGHSGTEYMFEDVDFGGIFTVYSLPFEYCVKPKASLVADATWTREHWLITYNRETESYQPSKVGYFLYNSVKLYRPNLEIIYEMVLEVLEDGFHITNKRTLSKGYYRIVGRSPKVFNKKATTRKPMFLESVEEATKADWKEAKANNVVRMEAFGESASMSW